MKITPNLNERFCKDMNIPIKLFEAPYFESRLRLYDTVFGTLAKYDLFLETLGKFHSEQSYFEAYNKLKDDVISYLQSNEEMKDFASEDFNAYSIKNIGFCSKDIFKQTFDGKYFLSIDMNKANFTALKKYNPAIVGGKATYEEFVGMFTEHEYFKSSKYIRQVVFGNNNPKRQVTYEKYLMDGVLTQLLEFTPKEAVVFYSNDEIVLNLSYLSSEEEKNKLSDKVQFILDAKENEGINLRQEVFLLRHIPNSDGYIRRFINKPGYDLKCIDSIMMPFVLRAYAGEQVMEEDMIFKHDGKLAKLIEVPAIEVV